ncbi:MAG: hypothetical protein ABJG41_03760 [Cyclobacteriaceae bacterium]
MRDFNTMSGSSPVMPKYIFRNYDVDSAYEQLIHWGWNEMYPSRQLTKTMVEKWAKGHKHGWRLHKVMRKMIISEPNLFKILKGH